MGRLLSWLRQDRGLSRPGILVSGGILASAIVAISISTTNPSGCDRTATTGTFAAQFAATTSGQSLCLASGAYGTFTGGLKTNVTIKPQSGATASMYLDWNCGGSTCTTARVSGITLDGLTINGADIVGNITYPASADAEQPKNWAIKNSTITAPIRIDGLVDANGLIDNNTLNNIDLPPASGGQVVCQSTPARIALPYDVPRWAGVTISNNTMIGGHTDGIQSGAGITVLNNRLDDIAEHGAECLENDDSPHTDAIQLINATNSVIRGNYITRVASGIVAYDRLQNVTIEDNVIDIQSAGRQGIEVYSDSNSIIRHNTLRFSSGCAFGADCGNIVLSRKTTDPVGTGTVIENNIATSIIIENSSTAATNRNNMLRSGATGSNFNGTPVFVGGNPPTTWIGFALTSLSPGRLAGSDGLDVGIRTS